MPYFISVTAILAKKCIAAHLFYQDTVRCVTIVSIKPGKRKKMMHSWFTRLAVIGVLVSMVALIGPGPVTYANPSEADAFAQDVVELTNAERTSRGLSPLKLQPNLGHSAAGRCEMCCKRLFLFD
jgi:uncharacterized protein YkwD